LAGRDAVHHLARGIDLLYLDGHRPRLRDRTAANHFGSAKSMALPDAGGGLLAVWIGWITFRESPISSGNFMFFGFLVTGFLIFLARSFPRSASDKSATRRR
jgi:hypothetical protein